MFDACSAYMGPDLEIIILLGRKEQKSGCPPFGEIQELFQDFQGPFSVNSRT